jgi:penicillin-binding protein 2
LGRLFYLQVAAGPKYRDAALSIQSRDVVTPATRGLIVDSSACHLALNRVGIAITVDRTKIDRQPDKGVAVIKSLAKLLNLEYKMFFNARDLCGELPKGACRMLDRFSFSTNSQLQKKLIPKLHFA